MLLTIQKFTLIGLFFILGITYMFFTNYYFEQKEETASVILHSMRNDMSELSYLLSKNLTSAESVRVNRAILDRVSSNNDYIAAIQIIDNGEVLLTTDPHYRKAPPRNKIYYNETVPAYRVLSDKQGLEGNIRFYEGRKLHKLKLLFLFNTGEIQTHFKDSRLNYILDFGLLPIILLLGSWGVLRYFVTIPLELLRQFAYYQSSVPKPFKLKELEAIRSSMRQTFERLDEEQKELYKMARTDRLSGLANRNALNEYVERLIADSLQTNREFAFLFLDIDHFKTVNDELGHIIGDELLKSVSAKIQKVIPSNDFAARVGGDEFVIVLHQYSSLSELTNIVERIQHTLARQWTVRRNIINITSSIGIAFYPKDAADITSLMQHSSMAMYEAKKKGRAQYSFFTKMLNKKVQDAITLDKAMRKALENDEYELYYQPKTDVVTGEIVGAEALIRWISPTEGFIAPNVFIPLAEENGFIVEIGDWVLQEAINQQIQWEKSGINIKLSINVATKQLLDRNFEYKFTTLLYDSKVDTSKIEIEITEYLFLEHNKNNMHILDVVKRNGVAISLDDFGTGYSSLSYLKKFPIDILKIDKVFMDDYNTAEGAIFVETIVKMGQTLNMKVIAEGVEEKEQVEYLKSIGCSTYQGYYCSKPLSAKDFEAFYRSYTPKI